jgi:uncharacterized membrane protein (UPF0127 family)
MAKKRILNTGFFLGTILVAFFVLYVFLPRPSCRDFNQGTVTINQEQEIKVNLAVTPDEQARGLSGCSSLELGQGMYFVFPTKTKAVFWMKDMVMPIDIIWISDEKVIGIERNVSPPNDSNLTKYHAPEEVGAVLEIGAGHSDLLQITEGTGIQLHKKAN